MYKLMIVDDEPFTVDGLHALVQDMNIPDLEIYTRIRPGRPWK